MTKQGNVPTAFLVCFAIKRNTCSASSQDFKHYISHLLSISQDLCGQTQGVAERLCQEVAHITRGCVQLVLHGQESAKASPLRRAITFSVHYRHRGYGTLFFISDLSPEIFLTDLEDLAQTCGCILYLLENTALVHVKGKRYDAQTGKPLTKRERDVLELMGRGQDRQVIARALKIAPGTINKHRQGIYAKLGVRCESEAIVAAYRAGLFSPLEGISPEHSVYPLQAEGEQPE